MKQIRRVLRDRFFSILERAFATDDGRRTIVDSLGSLLTPRPGGVDPDLLQQSPYHDLEWRADSATPSRSQDVVFLTSRFRSGSTLLWNLFRHHAQATSYYEPFNERRWFDPETRGERLDSTHLNVSDYWREYEGLDRLSNYFDERWIDRDLYMDEGSSNPDMQRYIDELVESAEGVPVLQFNRIDFRLPWLRRHYPDAKIIHQYRHPRDQWCSMLMDINCYPHTSRASFREPDKFYLLRWVEDLTYRFPFLAEQAWHPYQLHYCIWKLSYLYGLHYADHSVSLEELIEDPEQVLEEVFAIAGLGFDYADFQHLIAKPKFGKWREYAPETWFQDQERDCDQAVNEFMRALTPTEEHAARP